MRNILNLRLKTVLSVIAVLIINLLISPSASGQQWVVVNKDRTRPVEMLQTFTNNISTLNAPVVSSSFNNVEIIRNNGYHEIHWSTMNETSVRKFIIEYSVNGVDYLEAGQVIPTGKPYINNHYTTDAPPIL
jgi:hypothetical protein